MTTMVSVLFYLKNTVKTKNGLSPVYLRLTIEGLRLDFSTHRKVNKLDWNNQTGRVRGNSETDRILNNYLESLRNKAYQYVYELERDNICIYRSMVTPRYDSW